MKRISLLLALLFVLVGVSGWAADDESALEADPFAEPEVAAIADPLEPVNRGMFWINDKLYLYLFKPVARGLRIFPEPVRVSLSNVFSNAWTYPVSTADATDRVNLTGLTASLIVPILFFFARSIITGRGAPVADGGRRPSPW